MKLDDFKSTYAGKLFIVKITNPPALLSFDGLEDLKNYVFSDEHLKQLVFEKMTQTKTGHFLLRDDILTLDPDKQEELLYQHADKISLLEAITDGIDFMKVDVDALDPDSWKELNDSVSDVNHNSHATFDILAPLLK